MKFFLFMLFTFNLYALPSSKSEFCSRFESENSINVLSQSDENYMAFKNNGGLFNGGVCWWHSRFQRNAWYLLNLNQNAPKMSASEIPNLIKEIRLGKQILTLNGYQSFKEFTLENQAIIQQELEDWQVYDGLVLGGWIDGLKGNTTIDPKLLQEKILELYDYVNVKKKIGYQKLQIKGITSHAWLVIGLSKIDDSGIKIFYIDSNSPTATKEYIYKFGDKSFNLSGYGNFVPYLEFTREELRLDKIARSYCNKPFSEIDFSENDYQDDLNDFENNL